MNVIMSYLSTFIVFQGHILGQVRVKVMSSQINIAKRVYCAVIIIIKGFSCIISMPNMKVTNIMSIEILQKRAKAS